MPVLKFPSSVQEFLCYVRKHPTRDHRFIEFDFSIGDPDLTVELILPASAFEEFCAMHHARVLSADEEIRPDTHQATRYHVQAGSLTPI